MFVRVQWGKFEAWKPRNSSRPMKANVSPWKYLPTSTAYSCSSWRCQHAVCLHLGARSTVSRPTFRSKLGLLHAPVSGSLFLPDFVICALHKLVRSAEYWVFCAWFHYSLGLHISTSTFYDSCCTQIEMDVLFRITASGWISTIIVTVVGLDNNEIVMLGLIKLIKQ